MQQTLGPAYFRRLRDAYPEVPGRANYCVYWFRKTHDHLADGQRAGLVGTNTIRDTYSRQGGLDYIVANGGCITEAVSSQVWPGDAVVHVSIVNWKKGWEDGPKRLFQQVGDHTDSPWIVYKLDVINSALSPKADLSRAFDLKAHKKPKICHQGQTHGHDGFLLSFEIAEEYRARDDRANEFLFPYLIGENMIGTPDRRPTRFVIDFGETDIIEAQTCKPLFEHVKATVLPHRLDEAEKEQERNAELLAAEPKARVNRHHANFLKRWWQLSYRRSELLRQLQTIDRYIACVRHTKRPIFEFVSSQIRPGDSLQVFALDDDYSFGILQSDLHWDWFVERCSGIKGEWRYTPTTVFSSFPWPQAPAGSAIDEVAAAGVKVRSVRTDLMSRSGQDLRTLYASLEMPGTNPLREANKELNAAVRRAYGFSESTDGLAQLLELNFELARLEEAGQQITAPGYPGGPAKIPAKHVTEDCVRF